MYICGLYCQPAYFDNELVKLETWLSKAMDINKNNPNPTIITVGDFNAGDINWYENLAEYDSQQ